nr:hypothetical protein [Tanacetum cinerariifolium]
MIRDCNELVDKVQIRIKDWKNKSLSIAGQLQLIHSILGSMHINWALVVFLPNHVLLNIEQLMRQFLWSHGSLGKGKSKVAWEIVCLPNNEGGLGIRRLECFNSALMASHIWELLTLKETLWVKWMIFVIVTLRNTSLWFDMWADFEPLAAQISPRDIARSGLSLLSKVQDVIHHGLWNWRLFKKGKRSPDQIVECIKSFVGLKLLSCNLKKSKNGERLARLWDLPKAVLK